MNAATPNKQDDTKKPTPNTIQPKMSPEAIIDWWSSWSDRLGAAAIILGGFLAIITAFGWVAAWKAGKLKDDAFARYKQDSEERISNMNEKALALQLEIAKIKRQRLGGPPPTFPNLQQFSGISVRLVCVDESEPRFAAEQLYCIICQNWGYHSRPEYDRNLTPGISIGFNIRDENAKQASYLLANDLIDLGETVSMMASESGGMLPAGRILVFVGPKPDPDTEAATIATTKTLISENLDKKYMGH